MRIIFRADASPEIGTGHVMRCLALAQAWLEENGGTVTFLMVTAAPALEARLQAEGIQVAHLSVLPGSQEDAEQAAAQARALGVTWVVVDGYQFGADYQRVIKAAGLRLLFIDDYGHAEHYWADLVLNQNLSAQEGLYANREPATQLLLGTRYALLRKEFWPWRGWQRQNPTVACKVLLTMGGADPDNLTLKVIQVFQWVEIAGLEIWVVVGGSNPHSEQLKAAAQDSRVAMTLQRNVTNMPELMAWADVAIAAGGSTNWELALMGLPSLIISLAENQIPIATELDAQGIVSYLGWHQQVPPTEIVQAMEKLAHDRPQREKMSQVGQELIDGYGAKRIILDYLNQDQRLKLRAVREDDCELLWRWANDPEVRSRSFSSQPIPWDEHLQWFNSKLKSPNCRIYIAINIDDVPIGSIRFDIDQDEATVSISLDSQYRGQGYGSSLINSSCSKVFQSLVVTRINAYVEPNNQASIRAFLKAGFKPFGEVTFKHSRAILLIKHHWGERPLFEAVI